MATAGYPAPPAGSGFTCAQSGGAFIVSADVARFVVTDDALRATWDTVWHGRQQRRVPRAHVREVVVAPDTQSAASRDTTQLRIELTEGEPIVPLRRRPSAEMAWVADRLREALELTPRDWPSAAPARERPKPSANTGPRPVKPIGPPADVAPPVARNVRAVRRGDRLAIRIGTAWWARQRWLPPLAVVVAAALLGIFWSVVTVDGLLPIALAILLAAAWQIRRVAPVAATSHVMLLSPRGLHVTSVNCFKRDRRFIARARIAGAAVGEAHDGQPAELHVFLADGGRAEFLAGRPAEEIHFVAYELAHALPQIPPARASDDVGASAAPGGVLPYEPRRRPSREIEVRAAADGGVTIFIPPGPSPWTSLFPFVLPIILLTCAAVCIVWGPAARLVGEVWPAVLFVVVVALAWVTAYAILRTVRGDVPTVIGVDREFLYADFPDRYRRRKRWRRADVRDVQLVNVAASGQGTRPAQWVEIVFLSYDAPVRLCANHTPADRQRLVAVLRAALDLPGSP